MPRPVRVQYEGAWYHMLNRSDRRQPIFADDEDQRRLLARLARAGTKMN